MWCFVVWTDTFGGEPNGCWRRNAIVWSGDSDRARVRAAGRAMGWGPVRTVGDYGGEIEVRPSGAHVVGWVRPLDYGDSGTEDYQISARHPISGEPQVDSAILPVAPIDDADALSVWVRRALPRYDLRGAAVHAQPDGAIVVIGRPTGYFTRANGSIGIRRGAGPGFHSVVIRPQRD